MNTLILPVIGFDLEATLTSGQSFSWSKEGHGWLGWIQGLPCRIWQIEDSLYVESSGLSRDDLIHYFSLDVPITDILATFPAHDPWLDQAYAYAPGLRLLRQEPWETVCNFICSALKQVVQIEQINRDLRQAFGAEHPDGRFAFPTASQLVEVSETDLRGCRLGFRARHLSRAVRQIHSGEVSLAQIALLPTDEARIELGQLQGVGEKVANCVLLFAYHRWEAFPIDVWVERALRTLYFSHRRKISSLELASFAHDYFGRYRGYAQQFLFHWMRKEGYRLSGSGSRRKG